MKLAHTWNLSASDDGVEQSESLGLWVYGFID
jgi:hypothetical protein